MKNIEQLYNLNKHVASSDASRYHLNGVNVEKHDDETKRTLVATDGHILAVIEIESDIEIGFYHSDIIQSAFKLSKLNQDASAVSILKPTDGVRFVNWRCAYDKKAMRDVETDETQVLKHAVVCINPDLLSRLKKGLGLGKASGVELIIKESSAAIRVNCQVDGRHGVMMPMRGL